MRAGCKETNIVWSQSCKISRVGQYTKIKIVESRLQGAGWGGRGHSEYSFYLVDKTVLEMGGGDDYTTM